MLVLFDCLTSSVTLALARRFGDGLHCTACLRSCVSHEMFRPLVNYPYGRPRCTMYSRSSEIWYMIGPTRLFLQDMPEGPENSVVGMRGKSLGKRCDSRACKASRGYRPWHQNPWLECSGFFATRVHGISPWSETWRWDLRGLSPAY